MDESTILMYTRTYIGTLNSTEKDKHDLFAKESNPFDGQKRWDQPDLKLSAEFGHSNRIGEDGPSITPMFYSVVLNLKDMFYLHAGYYSKENSELRRSLARLIGFEI
ncbi:hypothetical protein DL96DRAFT_1564089 [Flagelloscypha sp. PMI_526]|nr:hypothetical protein DL96DRAFT_1564089 [Flagelloscypha sp. PMI_526]